MAFESISVRAGEAAVDGQFDCFFAEFPLQPGADGVESLLAEKFFIFLNFFVHIRFISFKYLVFVVKYILRILE